MGRVGWRDFRLTYFVSELASLIGLVFGHYRLNIRHYMVVVFFFFFKSFAHIDGLVGHLQR